MQLVLRSVMDVLSWSIWLISYTIDRNLSLFPRRLLYVKTVINETYLTMIKFLHELRVIL